MEINIIIRDEDNFIENVIKVKYDSKKYNNLMEMSDYLKEKYNKESMYYECKYDIECKKKYLYYLAKKNKKLNLDTDFNELSFDEYYKIVKNNKLTINALLVGGGCGGFTEVAKIIEIILNVWSWIKQICCFIGKIFIYCFPFYYITKEYGYGRKFLYDVIDNDSSWNYNFFDLEKIKSNKLLEKSVMRKFGYKLKKKKWQKEIYPDPSKSLKKYEDY